MSNRRRPAWDNRYRTRYLHSPAWFARRDRWFIDEAHRNGVVRCALCLGAGTSRTLELHHLDYHGVMQTPFGWRAHERHKDLTALHPRCHESVHQLIDRDRALSGLVSRRAASAEAIARLRTKIVRFVEVPETP
jgi:hypothetical protein